MSLGAGGGLIAASAAGPSQASSTVTVDPCRLVDTREGGSPVGAEQTVTFTAHGLCDVPATATALIANVTAVDPTAASFLSVFPADIPRPESSTVNWGAATTAVANGATIALSPAGTFSVFNLAGDVDVVVDVTGYLVAASAGPKGDTGAAGQDGAIGAAGAPGDAGAEGETGPQGVPGPTGATGAPGDTGATGDAGVAGVQGDTGDTGATGGPGPAGAQGEQGPVGVDNAFAYHLNPQDGTQLFVDLGAEFAASQFVVDCLTSDNSLTTGIHFTADFAGDPFVSVDGAAPFFVSGGETADVLTTSTPPGQTLKTVSAFIGRGNGGIEVTVTLLSTQQFHDCWAYVHVIWFPTTPLPTVTTIP